MKRRGRIKKRTTSFNPNREVIRKAVSDYLSSGGSITLLKAEQANYEVFMGNNDSGADVNEYLNESSLF